MAAKAAAVTAKPDIDVTTRFGAYPTSFFKRLVWQISDWRTLSASVRRRLRKRFARKVVGPFDIIHAGMKMRLYPAENYCDRIIFGRSELPERAEHEALVPYIKSGMTFVDVGANVGSYSCFVGTRAGGDVNLIAFEPHPRTFQKLQFNLAANGLPKAINAGVGPERGELKLWSDGGSNIGHTSMLKAGTANAKVSVTVPVVPLMDVLTKRGVKKVDLLKIDIEGFEDRALAPFLKAAPQSLLPDRILIEMSHKELWEEDLEAMFEGLNYRSVFETAENILFSRV